MSKNIIQKAISLGYEKHSGYYASDLDKQHIESKYKQIEYFLIQMWLINHHNIILTIDFNINDLEETDYYYEYCLRYHPLLNLGCVYFQESYKYSTLLDALEAGLEQSFNLIKK